MGLFSFLFGGDKKQTQTSSIGVAENAQKAQADLERLQKQLQQIQNQPGARRIGTPQHLQAKNLQKQIQGIQANLNQMGPYTPVSAQEQQALSAQNQGLTDLQSMIGQGPGAQDITAGLDAQRGFASMLEQYSKGGFLPGEQDIATARGTVNQLFAGQQTALQQQLDDQRKMAQRNAALSGRGINDPIFQNQLAQTQTRQQQLLESQMTSAAAEQAQNLPMQRLQFAEGLAQARLSLANQAMQNRQLLLSMGNQLREQERNFRLQAANRSQTSTESGGTGVLTGLAGLAAGVGSLGSGLSAVREAGGWGKVFGLGGADKGEQQGQAANPNTPLAQLPQGFNLPGSPVGGNAPTMNPQQSNIFNQIQSANAMTPAMQMQQSFNQFTGPQTSGYGQTSQAFYNPFMKRNY